MTTSPLAAATDPRPALRLLSLSAGVQSTTVLLLACEGEILCFDVAQFADTSWEPRACTRTSNGSPHTPRNTASPCVRSRLATSAPTPSTPATASCSCPPHPQPQRITRTREEVLLSYRIAFITRAYVAATSTTRTGRGNSAPHLVERTNSAKFRHIALRTSSESIPWTLARARSTSSTLPGRRP